MCNACIIENVKSSMLSRRSLSRPSAAVGVAAMAAGLTTAKTALAQSSGKVVDLTHAYDRNFPTFDGKPGIEMEKVVDFAKDGYTIYKLTIFEHTGTHIDAPLHFTADGTSVADGYSRVWGVDGLVVGGNALIPTANTMNPTLTSVAIAVRGARKAIEELSGS